MPRPAVLRPALRRLLEAAVSVTLAPLCAACESPLEAPLASAICDSCWTSIRPLAEPLCKLCGDSLPSWRVLGAALGRCARCRRIVPFTDASRSASDYSGAMRRVIHAFKYGKRRSLAVPLSGLMRSAAGPLLDDVECLVPVPLHPLRRLQRGFNQASDLAAFIGPPVVHALWRTEPTRPQAGLPASQRHRNVGSAFRLSPLLTSRTLDTRIRGGVIVLVDDVRTTGATLDACARVLKTAGAREVRSLTAARATLVSKDKE